MSPSTLAPSLNAAQLLRIDDVARIVSLSASHIYLLVSQGRFPKPILLGSRCSRFRSADVAVWLEALK
jgi:prophage regulatory protein